MQGIEDGSGVEPELQANADQVLEVAEEILLVLRAAARPVQVLDAEEELAVGSGRFVMSVRSSEC